MRILAMETTGAAASVALIDEQGNIVERASEQTLSHLQNLIPLTEALLKDRKLQIGDIDCIAVSEGPGSFTGIRIGMATAKALAQALGLPLIPVPTLRAFAWNAPDFGGLLCPVFDAKREQVYAGAYRWKDGTVLQAVADGAYGIEEFCELVRTAGADSGAGAGALWFGDGLKVYGQEILRLTPEGAVWQFAPEECRFQRASSVAALALELWKAGRTVSVEEIQPVYLRKAEAERKLEERRRAEQAAAEEGK